MAVPPPNYNMPPQTGGGFPAPPMYSGGAPHVSGNYAPQGGWGMGNPAQGPAWNSPGGWNISAPTVSHNGPQGVTASSTGAGVFGGVGPGSNSNILPGVGGGTPNMGGDPDLGSVGYGHTSGAPQAPQGNFFMQLLQALQGDISNQQQAQQQHWNAVNQAAGGIQDFAQGVHGQAMGGAQDALAGLMGMLQGGAFNTTFDPSQYGQQTQGILDQLMGAQQGAMGQFDQAAGQISQQAGQAVGQVNQAADAALGYAGDAADMAHGAVAKADEAVNKFNQDATANIGAQVAAMEARTRSQMRQVESGMNPDGTMMTPEQRAASLSQMQNDLNINIASTAASMQADYDRYAADLRSRAAQTRLGAGQTLLGASGQATAAGGLKLQAGAFQADVNSQLAQAKLATQNNMNQFMAGLSGDFAGTQAQLNLSASQHKVDAVSTAANFQLAAGQLMNMANLQGLQMELQGLTSAASFIQSNPQQPVSIFAGLAGMFQLATAPGAMGIQAMPLQGLGLGGPSAFGYTGGRVPVQ